VAHARELFNIARIASDRAQQYAEEAGKPVLTADAVVAIVLAVTAAEAFINELAEVAEIDLVRFEPDDYPDIASLGATMKELEEAKVSITGKYQVTAIVLSGSPFDRGSNPFQDFADLVRLRNLIVHLKPREDWELGGEPIGGPKTLARFENAGMTYASGDALLSWFNKLQTPAIAQWACDVALDMVRGLIAKIPAERTPMIDGLEEHWATL
jgi:hypothetical protein